jgi:hypothetical protein
MTKPFYLIDGRAGFENLNDVAKGLAPIGPPSAANDNTPAKKDDAA